MIDWIYDHPTWLWGSLLVLASAGAACGGLLAFHRLVPLHTRKDHNEVAGFTIGVIGVAYAVLLAFIAIATWETFSKVGEIVEHESDYAGTIYLDSQGLPAATGRQIREYASLYVSTVIDKEWPLQRAGKVPTEGWQPLRDLNTAIATMHPQNLGEEAIQAELLRTWDQLYLARSSRLSAVEDHMPAVIWWIIFLGAAITTGYTYLFGFHNFRMHLAMTGTLAATLALIIVLIIDLDRPFRGQITVSPAPFIMTQRSWEGLPPEK